MNKPAKKIEQPQNAALPRARGGVKLAFRLQDGKNALANLRQEGCMKAFLPRPAGDVPEAVLVNTSGGLTGGDKLTAELVVETGASAMFTTQAYEKVYKSSGGMAEVRTIITVGEHASAAWIPQEAIFFDRAQLSRSLEVELAKNASFIGLESVVFGRTAMKEVVMQGAFRERWQIRREGELIYSDLSRLEGDMRSRLDHPVVLNGGNAMATLVAAGSDVSELLTPLREMMTKEEIDGGASLIKDLLVVRIIAIDGNMLRRNMALILPLLRANQPLPKVWLC